jgi:hypothetical protein
MGIETYGSMVFSSMKQILNDVHDTDVYTGSHLVVLWSIPDFIRNSRWVDFQQGLPDMDTLDPRDKYLIILDDLMDETDQRVTGKWMDPRHEMIGILFIGNVKYVRIVGFQNIIRFFFITL